MAIEESKEQVTVHCGKYQLGLLPVPLPCLQFSENPVYKKNKNDLCKFKSKASDHQAQPTAAIFKDRDCRASMRLWPVPNTKSGANGATQKPHMYIFRKNR